jgi:hypothetical protein
MCVFYSVFLRTAEGVRRTKEVLEQLINSPLKQLGNYEIFTGTFLGVIVQAAWMDDDLNQTVVQYHDEFIPLSTYDLEIKIWYDKHAFIRDHREEWSQAVATVLADALCKSLSCESLAVETVYRKAFARHMPFEERFINR